MKFSHYLCISFATCILVRSSVSMSRQPSSPPKQGRNRSEGPVANRARSPGEAAKQVGSSTDIAMLFRSNPMDADALLARVIQLMNANEMLVLFSLLKYYISLIENRTEIPLLAVLALARAYSSINEHKLAVEILQLYLEDDAYVTARARVEGYETPFSCKMVLLLPFIIETHLLYSMSSPLAYAGSILEAKDKVYMEKFSILFLCITDIFKLYADADTLLETDALFARVVNDVATVHNILTIKISATLGQSEPTKEPDCLRRKIYILRKHLGLLIPMINASAFSSISLIAKCILCFIELIRDYRLILKEDLAELVFGKGTSQKVQEELAQLIKKSHILVLKAMTLYAEQQVGGTVTVPGSADPAYETSFSATDARDTIVVATPRVYPQDDSTVSICTPTRSTDSVSRIRELVTGPSRPASSVQTLGPSGNNGFTEFSKPCTIPTVNPHIQLHSFFIGRDTIDIQAPKMKEDSDKPGINRGRESNWTASTHTSGTDELMNPQVELHPQSRARRALDIWYEKTLQSKVTFQMLLNLANVLKISQFNTISEYDEIVYFMSVILSDFESHINSTRRLSDFLVLVFEIIRMIIGISDQLVRKYSTVAYILYSYAIKVSTVYCDIERKIGLRFNVEEQYKAYMAPLQEILRELSIILPSQKLKARYSIDIAYENGDMFFLEILDGNLTRALCFEHEYSISELSRLAARRIAIIEFTLSLALFNARLYLDAALWLERATLHCNRLEEAWILLARTYFNIGEREKSVQAASMCYRLNPANSQAKRYCESALPEIGIHIELAAQCSSGAEVQK